MKNAGNVLLSLFQLLLQSLEFLIFGMQFRLDTMKSQLCLNLFCIDLGYRMVLQVDKV